MHRDSHTPSTQTSTLKEMEAGSSSSAPGLTQLLISITTLYIGILMKLCKLADHFCSSIALPLCVITYRSMIKYPLFIYKSKNNDDAMKSKGNGERKDTSMPQHSIKLLALQVDYHFCAQLFQQKLNSLPESFVKLLLSQLNYFTTISSRHAIHLLDNPEGT